MARLQTFHFLAGLGFHGSYEKRSPILKKEPPQSIMLILNISRDGQVQMSQQFRNTPIMTHVRKNDRLYLFAELAISFQILIHGVIAFAMISLIRLSGLR
ncbi:hypothetical protein CVU37_07510 [candidate division BRC1 bacterium HGW-BRC1-1]|nr:MAG: hypothetical protein CVU37_07510 [candidate division BRC1 bacterium HGW-BRC1-1]